MKPTRLSAGFALAASSLVWAAALGPGCGGSPGEDLFAPVAFSGAAGAGAQGGSGGGGGSADNQGGSAQSGQGGAPAGQAGSGQGGQAGDESMVFGGGGSDQGEGGSDAFGGGDGQGGSLFGGSGGSGGSSGSAGTGGSGPVPIAKVPCATSQQGPTDCAGGKGCCLIPNSPDKCALPSQCDPADFLGCNEPTDCPGGACCIEKESYHAQCRPSCQQHERPMCRPGPAGVSADCPVGTFCKPIGNAGLYHECKFPTEQ